jgi:hypothetical protein
MAQWHHQSRAKQMTTAIIIPAAAATDCPASMLDQLRGKEDDNKDKCLAMAAE